MTTQTNVLLSFSDWESDETPDIELCVTFLFLLTPKHARLRDLNDTSDYDYHGPGFVLILDCLPPTQWSPLKILLPAHRKSLQFKLE